MSQRKHLIHVKSNQTATGTSDPKAPLASDLSYGEIAINYLADKERMFIKNSNNEIVSFVSSKVIEENEEVIAQALAVENEERIEAENEINDTISELEQTVENNERVSAAAMADLDSRISEVTQTVEDNELVIAAALSEINDKIDNLIEITYSELVSLKNGNNLSKGTYYRITDYNTTTVQENTQSANHPFDVIVLAQSNNTLSENAQAIQHAGDSYFTDCKLSAWELKYCIENDTDRFAWADPTQGKGVIFYMKDEWNNECPYDFKNIQFKRWAVTDITSSTLSGDALNELKNTYVFSSNGGKHFAAKNAYGGWIPSSQGITITVDENSFGWYYTFNGMSSENGETVNETYDVSTHHFKVTQDCIDYIINEDGSGLNTQDICFDNKVLEFMQEYIGDDLYSKGRYVLNNIVFINGLSFCYYNEDDGQWEFSTAECYGNVFKSNCNSNTFGNYVSNNTFGNSCGDNTFGNYSQFNSFGNSCGDNTFGNDCGSNTFGNSCGDNTFGNNCWNNTFGNDCWNNTFGNNSRNNTFGNYFQFNSFGNSCGDNTFGNNCGSNTFGNNAYGNTFGNGCNRNSFGNGCGSNTFGNYVGNNTFGNDIQFIRFVKEVSNNGTTTEVGADYIYWCVVENGNKRIKVTFSSATSSSSVAGNITITQGVNNATYNGTNNSNWVNITNNDIIPLNNSTKTTKRTIYRPSTTTVDIPI